MARIVSLLDCSLRCESIALIDFHPPSVANVGEGSLPWGTFAKENVQGLELDWDKMKSYFSSFTEQSQYIIIP